MVLTGQYLMKFFGLAALGEKQKLQCLSANAQATNQVF